MKKRFVSVIGKGGAGKSTVITALTGCRSHGVSDWVTDNLTRRWMWVICSSPEELHMPIRKLREIVAEAAESPECIALVIAIQPTQPTKRLALEEIFREVDQTGAFDNYSYVLAQGYGGKDIDFEEAKRRISTASPKSTVHSIDGRRLAFLNAAFIRNSCGVPY